MVCMNDNTGMDIATQKGFGSHGIKYEKAGASEFHLILPLNIQLSHRYRQKKE